MYFSILADVYAVIAYYLNNRTIIDEYLKKRAEEAAKIRAEIEGKPEYKVFRERLLARHQERQNQTNLVNQ